ncbi:hypothetical protein GCM10011386_29870 [Parapedobacter defluvii]|uniref:DUF3298 domain-containing protein n=2 Tax=Parapedobacter defluvii TaxID=2045106 RepID=A0ABQ1MAG0_9SPHI|nr:hypothetical protein GCM10011386_29870 [Parapedobacter defluvii]
MGKRFIGILDFILMRKKTINTGWIYFGVACVFSACQFNSESSDAGKQAVTTDTLAYEYQHYVLYSDHIVKTNETTDTSFYAVSYPSFKDSAVNRFVLTTLLGSDTATVEGSARTFVNEFDEFFLSDAFPRVWTSESHEKVYNITPTYLGLVTDVYTYTGGAHGNYATVFAHYDLANHTPLILDDIVTKPFQNELIAVAERYFRKQENLAVDQPLDDRYFFDQGRFHIPDNFALEQDSLLFLYNIYEIKPYVDGQTKLRVPYKEIDRLLTDLAKRIVAELTDK